MSPLRVAVDVTPLIGRPTGVGQVVAGLLAAFEQRDDVAVRPFAVTWRGRRDVRAQSLPMPARPLRALWRHTDRPPIEWWTGSVDVVHGTNYVVPPARRAAEVVSVHDLTFVRHPEMCTPDTLEYGDLIRRAVRRGAFVHTDSCFVADELREWLGGAVDDARIRAVHPGVPPVADRRADPELPSSVRPPYVLALGTVEPRKGLPTLVRAFAGLRTSRGRADLQLVVVGRDGWGVDAYGAAVAALDPSVRERVVRLDYVSPEVRGRLLRDATVFAYPSVYEGFGFPPLEAMSCGVPVVSTTAGSLPEVLGDGAVLVAPGDADALCDALASVLDDDAARRALIDRGRARVARFTWERCADGLVALYRSAVDA